MSQQKPSGRAVVCIGTVLPAKKPAAVVCIEAARPRHFERRNALVEQHLELVRSIAHQVKKSLPPSFDLDDLIAVGNLALLEAANRYRPAEHGGTPFSAYARVCVRGAIIESVRRRHWRENTRPPIAYIDSGDKCRGEVREPSVAPVIDTVIDQGRLRRRLAHEIAYLDPSQRAVILAYYGEEDSSKARVAEQLGETVWTIGKLKAAALENLRRRKIA